MPKITESSLISEFVSNTKAGLLSDVYCGGVKMGISMPYRLSDDEISF